MINMLEIYNKLLKEFGKQNWWPSKTRSKFEICIGAILTQNTNWRNVEKAINNLIENNMLSKEAIKKANVNKLSALIKSSGYYKQKAKKLKAFVNFNGTITREDILSIWGIGPETADSMLLYAYNKQYFVVDAYTKRIFTRLGVLDGKEDYEEVRDIFESKLPKDVELYKEFHALIVTLGKKFCKKKPECNECPLNDDCKYSI
jgi:endonuclease-3 related protein